MVSFGSTSISVAFHFNKFKKSSQIDLGGFFNIVYKAVFKSSSGAAKTALFLEFRNRKEVS